MPFISIKQSIDHHFSTLVILFLWLDQLPLCPCCVSKSYRRIWHNLFGSSSDGVGNGKSKTRITFFYVNQFFGEWGFSWRAIKTWRDFFFFLLLFPVWILAVFSLLILKICIFIEDYPSNKPVISFRFLLVFDGSANEMRWSTSVGRVSLPRIRFWFVIQSKHHIRVCLIRGFSPRLVGEYLLSQWG